MRDEIAILAEKSVHMPSPVVPESLMSLFTESPTTQALDDFWGELPKERSHKRKQKDVDADAKHPTHLSKEEN
ncbi:hypothetical protein R3W88_001209 [Solanum pinnatisectum]|uniref:Uncharacterized protein n=1 Tax=Solanum pinnatisectum TaxID=50273 RepID=A0AAV9MHJ8_9SOLN|nr:hypothetical protein R3W88_001209 [Solanum pinnatisectum]